METYPPIATVVREAAELVAIYDAMRAARRGVALRMASLAHDFVVRLTRAQGRKERYEVAPPASFLGRSMTLLVRVDRGRGEALLAPTTLSHETARAWLDEGNSGLFHRPEDWADTRYFDAFSVFCAPSSWGRVANPIDGIGALAAYAAISLHGVDERTLKQHMAEFGAEGFLWSTALLAKIRTTAKKVELPDREPPYIPTRILPYAAQRELGWGEALAFWLYADKFGPGLTAKQVGRMLGIAEPAQVRRMARVAGRKVGEDTLMRLVPPWPKESAPITIKEPEYDLPDAKGGEQ